MPDLERLHRSLELHLNKDDPVETARLKHGHKMLDKGRIEGAIAATILYGVVLTVFLLDRFG